MTRPDQADYTHYYHKYISLVPDGDIVATLQAQLESTLALLRSIPAEKADYAYAPGKWTIKQAIGHVNDTERVFAYRALCIGRGDQTPLPGFEQDDFIANTDYNPRTLTDLIEEFAAVRQASLHLLKHFTDTEWNRSGTASGNHTTAKALAFMIAGHDLYHCALMRERYLAE